MHSAILGYMHSTRTLLLVLFVQLLPSLALADDWEKMFEEQGVTVWKREVPGNAIVQFRGRGIVEAPMLQVGAVIRAADRGTEWIENCVASRFVRYHSALRAIIYHRTESPGPFDDRDVVLDATFEPDTEKKTLWIKFQQTAGGEVPLPDDTVRMPTLVGHFKLVEIDSGRTEVEYQVQADPGGAIPAWVANWVTKKLPFNTLVNLRRQARSSGYEKHRELLEIALEALQNGKSVPLQLPGELSLGRPTDSY